MLVYAMRVREDAAGVDSWPNNSIALFARKLVRMGGAGGADRT